MGVCTAALPGRPTNFFSGAARHIWEAKCQLMGSTSLLSCVDMVPILVKDVMPTDPTWS